MTKKNSYEDVLKSRLPEGIIYYGVKEPIGDDFILIEYLDNGIVEQRKINKINLNDHYSKRVEVQFVKGMTYEDLYELLSDRYGLGLVNEIDYVLRGEIEFDDILLLTLPIAATSYGYKGSFSFYLYKDPYGSITNGWARKDFRDLSFRFTEGSRGLQSKLSSKLFVSDKQMFTANILTMNAKDVMRSHLRGCDRALIEDAVNGYATSIFNDGLSDVVIFTTQLNHTYAARFKSSKGDLPVIK